MTLINEEWLESNDASHGLIHWWKQQGLVLDTVEIHSHVVGDYNGYIAELRSFPIERIFVDGELHQLLYFDNVVASIRPLEENATKWYYSDNRLPIVKRYDVNGKLLSTSSGDGTTELYYPNPITGDLVSKVSTNTDRTILFNYEDGLLMSVMNTVRADIEYTYNIEGLVDVEECDNSRKSYNYASDGGGVRVSLVVGSTERVTEYMFIHEDNKFTVVCNESPILEIKHSDIHG